MIILKLPRKTHGGWVVFGKRFDGNSTSPSQQATCFLLDYMSPKGWWEPVW